MDYLQTLHQDKIEDLLSWHLLAQSQQSKHHNYK